MIKKFRRMINGVQNISDKINKIEKDIENIKISIGKIYGQQLEQMNLEKCEYKVFSQWGEDGIIQALINNVPIENRIFIEFGVEDYSEANTRYLLMNNNWSGLIIDGSEVNIKKVKNSELYWRYNLKAVNKFITRENINELFVENGIQGDIGLLSIDIDGNDYWVWEAINTISPRIVICEYNSLFGVERKLTTPYDAKFVRSEYDASNLVYGASVRALEFLGNIKGYFLVSGNSAGNNLFFVRKDVLGRLKVKTAEEVYVEAQFREGRKDGQLTFDDFSQRKKAVGSCKVYDLDRNELVSLGAIISDRGK